MARITLLRHAKAENPDMATADFDRTLAARGRRNADRIGRFVRDTVCSRTHHPVALRPHAPDARDCLGALA